MKTLNTKAFTLWARPHMVIRGFKHLNEGMQCQGFEFEINKEYIHEGDLKMCEQGFHFCEKLSQIPLYKNIFKGSTHIVEARNVIFGQDKIVCRSIKIISLPLSFQEWLFFANDGKNNCGFGNQGDGNQGDGNRGNWNQGNGNQGNWNQGDRNQGNWNQGNSNQGNWNRGNGNQGNGNQGDGNQGNWNQGDRNQGDRNQGDWNQGDRNQGDWNQGNGNQE